MATMTISLPEPMREFIETEVAEGDYGSASELFREMVRDRQKRKAQERLELLLLNGLESGNPIKITEDYIDRHRKELLSKIKKQKK
jgi:antitoxin ParD1/3/4